MSNNSTPSFDGYEYRRILEEIPFEDDAQRMNEHDENGIWGHSKFIILK